ncbi:DUF2092 domain-containing protein [Homoserinimonas sp. OAct 916]|uniref:LolA family protein n=1 Tax=Homoserinimonas sp. OAct 916 TaxID=2211450 RepID=UPI001E5CC2A5|nr:DUF2092 domain-containing protein [Homoserinimonas sp. OAct 916]
MVATTSVDAFSGTVVQTADLGLPELPQIGQTAGSGSNAPGTDSGQTASIAAALEFLTGTHTARVFVDGPTKTRLQVMDSLAERDLVHNGSNVWLYDSAKNAATRVTLPQGDATVPNDGSTTIQTPAEMADRLLASVGPSTTVTVGDNTRVAGRPVYDLVLTPKSADTLVGSVSIGVDSETGLPLQVLVRARGQQSPAFRIAFSDVTLTAPSAGLFDFTPPAGATVTQQALPQSNSATGHATMPAAPPTVTGTGWDTVVSLPAGQGTSTMLDSPMLAQVTTSVSGGRLLSTSLLNVYLSQDGRVFAGAVPLSVLQSAATGR